MTDERDAGRRHGASGPPSTHEPSRWIRGLGTDRSIGLACSVLLLGLLLGHSLLAPTYRGPDEPQHFDLAREWSMSADYELTSRQLSLQVARSLAIVRFGSQSRNLRQEEAPARSDRPRFDELGPDVDGDSYNQISQHGPLYPVVVGSSLAAMDAIDPGPRWAFDREVGLARLLTILLVTPVPFLIYLSSRELGLSPLASWVSAILPAAVPQFTHVNAAVNNDSLMVLIAAGLLYLVSCELRRARSMRRLLGIGLLLGVGMLTKIFVIGPAAAVGAALVLVSWRDRRTVRKMALDAGLVTAAVLVGGGWWLVRNLIVRGTLQPEGEPLLPPAPGSFEPDVGQWFHAFTNTIPHTAIGRFGWLELPLGWPWVRGLLVVIGLGAVTGVVRATIAATRRSVTAPLGVVESMILLAPLVVLTLSVAAATYGGHVETGRFPGLQGRYLFAALPFLAVVVAAGIGWVRPQLRFVLAVVAVGGVFAVQWASASTMLRYWWGPDDGSLRDQVAAMVTWSPWPVTMTVSFALVAAIGAVWCAASGLLAARRDLQAASTPTGPAGQTDGAPSTDTGSPVTVPR